MEQVKKVLNFGGGEEGSTRHVPIEGIFTHTLATSDLKRHTSYSLGN